MTGSRAAFLVARCIAAGFALSAAGRHPYDFYVLVRWIVFTACCWGIFSVRKRLWPSAVPIYLFVGIVFNPMVPLHFARTTWHNLDIAAGLLLLTSLLFREPSGGTKSNEI
jgi:hypothetical protein